MPTTNARHLKVLAPAWLIVFALLIGGAFSWSAIAAAAVSSLTLSPATIVGGTGGTSTNSQNITVRSNLGARPSRAVTEN